MTWEYNPYSLIGKNILVTGASSGIGKATAIECSKLGAKVIINGRNENRLNETFELLEGEGHSKFIANICSESELTALIDFLPELNGLVHAAGIVSTLPFQFINKTDLNNIFNINFIAPVLLSQKLLKAKKISHQGSVVFISSIDGPLIAHVGNSMYAASKGAITAITKSMALELAPKKIRVNGVLPGMTETPLINSETFTKDQLESDMKKYPLKRYGIPEEIAYAIIFLLSDASTWITGTNLIIDGGFTLS